MDFEFRSVLQKFVSNLWAGGGRGCLHAVSVLGVLPFLAAGLGAEGFGIYAMIAIFLRIGYYGSFDFGLSISVVKFASEAVHDPDSKMASKVATFALVAYFGLVVILLLTFQVCGLFIIEHLYEGSMATVGLFSTIRIGLVAYSLYLLANAFWGLLVARPGFHITHVIGSCVLIAELLGVVGLFLLGLTLSRLFALHILIAASLFVVCYIVSRRYYPGLHLSLRGFRLIDFKAFLGYGVKVGFITVSVSALSIYDRLIIGYFAGVIYVGFYEAAARVVELTRRIPQLFLLPLLPVASELQSNGQRTVLRRLYQSTIWLQVAVSLPIHLVPTICAFPFVYYWLGPNFEPSAFAIIVLSLAALLSGLALPGSQMLSGMNEFKPILSSVYLTLATSFVLNPILAFLYGFHGAVVASGLALATGSIFFIWKTNKLPLLVIDLPSVRSSSILGLACSALVAVPVALVLRQWSQHSRMMIVIWVVLLALTVSYSLSLLRSLSWQGTSLETGSNLGE